MKVSLETLCPAELIVVRRLREGPLTEFELANEVAESSGYTPDQAEAKVPTWLEDLRQKGLIWAGELSNRRGQTLIAAALTKRGLELVN